MSGEGLEVTMANNDGAALSGMEDQLTSPSAMLRIMKPPEDTRFPAYFPHATRIFAIVEGVRFTMFTTVVILVASLLIGVQAYENMVREYGDILDGLDKVIAAIFTVECILRLSSAGSVKRYSQDKEPELTREQARHGQWIVDPENGGWMRLEAFEPWRYFLSGWNCLDFIVVLFSWIPLGNSGNIVLLRLLRLLRVLKLVRAVAELQVILDGLSSGFTSIIYILLLIFLVFYVYAIIGILLFRDNDYIHFRSLDIALLTLFRVSTLEDWTDVMYINMFGCEKYGYFDGNNMAKYCLVADAVTGEIKNNSKGLGVWSSIYFVSLVVIVALVMLSLFIGVITSSMQEAAEKLKDQKLKDRRRAQNQLSENHEEEEKKGVLAKMRSHLDDPVDCLVTMNNRHSNLMPLHTEMSPERRRQYDPEGGSDFVVMYGRSALWMKGMVEHPNSVNFMTAVILAASILVGIGTERSLEDNSILSACDWVVLIIFTVEAVLKIFAEGLRPWYYFTDRLQGSWNTFDFFVVVLCYVPSTGSMAPVLRLARLMRVLKLIQAVPQLQIIIKGLIQGLSSIFYITMLLLLVFYIFAIAAINLFRDNDPWHFPNIETALLTLFRVATGEDWTDVMYINMYGCDKYPFEDFGTGAAYEQLTGVPKYKLSPELGGNATDPNNLYEWGCSEPKGYTWFAAFFFVIFVVVSAMVMLSLFVAVVTTGMEDAANKVKEGAAVKRKLKAISKFAASRDVKFDQAEMNIYVSMFKAVDPTDSGKLYADELQVVFQSLRREWPMDAITEIFATTDLDEDNALQFGEFTLLMLVLLHPQMIDDAAVTDFLAESAATATKDEIEIARLKLGAVTARAALVKKSDHDEGDDNGLIGPGI